MCILNTHFFLQKRLLTILLSLIFQAHTVFTCIYNKTVSYKVDKSIKGQGNDFINKM